ncbi:MAG: hypothetical protein ABIL04_02515 [candidate division WOR-3 bacterium]
MMSEVSSGKKKPNFDYGFIDVGRHYDGSPRSYQLRHRLGCLGGLRQAEVLWETGVYEPSRLPGNPLFEYILTIIYPLGGYISSNLFVLVMFGLSIFAFWQLVKEEINNMVLVSIFALTPILLVNAVTTLDYIPGLACLILSYLYATKKNYILTSLFLGLAIGFRLSNAFVLVSLILFFVLNRDKISKIFFFSILSLGIGLIFYLPIFIRYRFEMFNIPTSLLWHNPVLYWERTIYNLILLFGPIATIGIILIFLINRSNILQSLKKDLKGKSPIFIFKGATLILFLLLFFRHSDETAYLIPIIPFFYLLIAHWLSKRQLILVGILIFSSAFLGLQIKRSERWGITLKPVWGTVIEDYLMRKELEYLREGIAKINLPNKVVILTGLGPQLTYKNNWLVEAKKEDLTEDLEPNGISGPIFRIKNREIFLVHSVSLENAIRLQKGGYGLYMFSFYAPGVAIHKYHYDPYQLGIKELKITGRDAFYRR